VLGQRERAHRLKRRVPAGNIGCRLSVVPGTVATD
jgi:hypothetical protein